MDYGCELYNTSSAGRLKKLDSIQRSLHGKNRPMLTQIYGILTELQNQEKQLTVCKVPAHIELKETKKQTKAQNGQ